MGIISSKKNTKSNRSNAPLVSITGMPTSDNNTTAAASNVACFDTWTSAVISKEEHFNSLPKEIILEVFSYLNVQELHLADQCCKHWRLISEQSWKRLSHYIDPNCPSTTDNWKYYYHRCCFPFPEKLKILQRITRNVRISQHLNTKSLFYIVRAWGNPTENSLIPHHPFLLRSFYQYSTEEDENTRRIVCEFKDIKNEELLSYWNKNVFQPSVCKMYAAQVALAASHLIEHGYWVLRFCDISFVDEQGYIFLFDYEYHIYNLNEKHGFLMNGISNFECIAPEVLLGQEYTSSATWYSFGCFFYEILFGLPPYYSDHVPEMCQKIIEGELKISDEITDPHLISLLRALMNKNPTTRIQNFEELKSHPYWEGFDWDKVYRKDFTPEFLNKHRNS